MDYLFIVRSDNSVKFSISPEDMKLFARGIELAYLTKGNFDHVMWMLIGETGHPEIALVGYAQGAIQIYKDEAFLTRYNDYLN